MEDNMDKADVQAALKAAGLARVIKDIDYIARPSIRLYATPVDEPTLKVGVSKLGGLPDLPPGTKWPECNGLPQSFIAQIHLDDIRSYDSENVLPHNGTLWFFYDAQQQTFGDNPSNLGCWQVIFVNDDSTPLQRTSAPTQLPASSQFKACSLRFASEMTLTQHPELDVPNFDWTDEEQQKYENLLSTFPDSADRAAIHHRLLGNPDAIQDDMRQECQLASHGISVTDIDYSDPRIAELSKGDKDWQLLLQIDSDEHAGMRWGNSGMIYYWMKQEDLQAHRFDATWLVLQSE
jgi:uncharacterized protein YwqG